MPAQHNESTTSTVCILYIYYIYVRACRPPSKLDLQDERAAFHSWPRLTQLNVVGFFLFLLYLAASACYLAARAYFSLRGLRGLFAYGVTVLVAEGLSIVSLAFHGIWLCARTNQADVRSKDMTGAALRRLYNIRVFILCKDEPLALVRRTVASVHNAYATDGCERVVYLLDASRDPAKRDFFMAGDGAAADVVYIAPPPRTADSKARCI